MYFKSVQVFRYIFDQISLMSCFNVIVVKHRTVASRNNEMFSCKKKFWCCRYCLAFIDIHCPSTCRLSLFVFTYIATWYVWLSHVPIVLYLWFRFDVLVHTLHTSSSCKMRMCVDIFLAHNIEYRMSTPILNNWLRSFLSLTFTL